MAAEMPQNHLHSIPGHYSYSLCKRFCASLLHSDFCSSMNFEYELIRCGLVSMQGGSPNNRISYEVHRKLSSPEGRQRSCRSSPLPSSLSHPRQDPFQILELAMPLPLENG